MMTHQMLAHLRTLKRDGLVAGLEEQPTQPGMLEMSFEERLSLLVDREIHVRKCYRNSWHKTEFTRQQP